MTDTILRGEHLTKDFGRGRSHRPWARTAPSRPALLDVSVTLARGEILGIVGESGSGKSTLVRSLTLLERPDSGTVFLEGTELTALRPAELRAQRRRIQTVFQDPYSSLNPRMTVGQTLREVLAVHALARGAEATKRVQTLVDLVGLPSRALSRYPSDFSGGQRQRICIARALAAEPTILVADEAVSALDVSIQAQILNLMGALRNELHLSMVFISHDLGVVNYIADRVGVMFGGRIIETLGRGERLENARHPYTRALHDALPSLAAGLPNPPPRGVPIVSTIQGCPFRGRCPNAEVDCEAIDPELTEVAAGHEVACHHPHLDHTGAHL